LSNLSKSVHTGENSQILSIEQKNILMQDIFLLFLEILLSKGIHSFLCDYNQKKKTLKESIKKIIGYYLKNKTCPLPING
jgi:hypothetical protein